ncbi:MAG: hypothetical protein PVF58_14260 [Candidatus Methanofastidiosia archaeon]|jgi:hypothetical protein
MNLPNILGNGNRNQQVIGKLTPETILDILTIVVDNALAAQPGTVNSQTVIQKTLKSVVDQAKSDPNMVKQIAEQVKNTPGSSVQHINQQTGELTPPTRQPVQGGAGEAPQIQVSNITRPSLGPGGEEPNYTQQNVQYDTNQYKSQPGIQEQPPRTPPQAAPQLATPTRQPVQGGAGQASQGGGLSVPGQRVQHSTPGQVNLQTGGQNLTMNQPRNQTRGQGVYGGPVVNPHLKPIAWQQKRGNTGSGGFRQAHRVGQQDVEDYFNQFRG